MFKLTVSFLCLLILQACATQSPKPDSTTDNRGYFADAADCYQSSLRKSQVKVPTANSQTNVEIPLVYDAGAFSNCMLHSGHAAPKADPERYLELSRRCLHEARGANLDDSYADCIRKGDISVDVVIERKAN